MSTGSHFFLIKSALSTSFVTDPESITNPKQVLVAWSPEEGCYSSLDHIDKLRQNAHQYRDHLYSQFDREMPALLKSAERVEDFQEKTQSTLTMTKGMIIASKSYARSIIQVQEHEKYKAKVGQFKAICLLMKEFNDLKKKYIHACSIFCLNSIQTLIKDMFKKLSIIQKQIPSVCADIKEFCKNEGLDLDEVTIFKKSVEKLMNNKDNRISLVHFYNLMLYTEDKKILANEIKRHYKDDNLTIFGDLFSVIKLFKDNMSGVDVFEECLKPIKEKHYKYMNNLTPAGVIDNIEMIEYSRYADISHIFAKSNFLSKINKDTKVLFNDQKPTKTLEEIVDRLLKGNQKYPRVFIYLVDSSIELLKKAIVENDENVAEKYKIQYNKETRNNEGISFKGDRTLKEAGLSLMSNTDNLAADERNKVRIEIIKNLKNAAIEISEGYQNKK